MNNDNAHPRNQPPRRRIYRQPPREEAYSDYDDYPPEPAPPPRRRPLPPHRRPRQRRVWPLLLTGCGLGVLFTVLAAAAVVFFAVRTTTVGTSPSLPIIGGSQSFSYDEKPSFPPLSSLTQLQICDKFGNVSIKVDPQAQSPSVTAHKVVQAPTQSAADQLNHNLTIQVASPQDISQLSCLQPSSMTQSSSSPTNSALTVNVSFPDTGSMVHASNNHVDLSLVLPPSLVQSDGPSLSLNVEAPVGNISVDGLSGLFTLRGGTGNISVTHAALAPNSQIDTSQGNVTFNGFLLLPTGSNSSAQYSIRSEQGTLDLTLPPNTNVTLDANTNVGKITSTFPITSTANSDGSASYRGPLSPPSTPPDSLLLVVDVSTGNINIHQLQTSS